MLWGTPIGTPPNMFSVNPKETDVAIFAIHPLRPAASRQVLQAVSDEPEIPLEEIQKEKKAAARVRLMWRSWCPVNSRRMGGILRNGSKRQFLL